MNLSIRVLRFTMMPLVLSVIVGCGGDSSGTTPTPTPEISEPTPSPSPEVTITPSPELSPSPSPSPSPSASVSPSPEPSPSAAPTAGIFTDWIVNTTEFSQYLDNGTSLVNVQSVESETVNGAEYAVVSASGVPNYVVTMTEGLVNWLNERPRAESDFDTGQTLAVAGQDYDFGADIGYAGNCDEGVGKGYWPPGPACPTDQTGAGSSTVSFPVEPEPTTTECLTGANTVGYAVNGVPIFSWWDGQSYQGQGDWQNLASIAEQYDVDICGGHAANGTYHHHHYSDCWARAAGEDYSGHSEIYGYAADGYPVYGPYENTGVVAKSCWVARDYSVSSVEEGYGCVGESGAIAGERNCFLVDPYNPDLGVEASPTEGPTTSDTVLSLSQNEFLVSSGFYFQDYYYDSDCTAQGEEYLDQYNGHSDDERGYHYHLTIATVSAADDVPVTPVFPFTFGPRFAGELQDNAVTSCSTGEAPGGGGGGGRP